jgi:electron transfer flavoprotein beta subunit
MNIFVPIQLVPDLVEELVIAADGRELDADATHWIVSEFDDHAIEQAILLKESNDCTVTILAPDFEGADDALFQAAAKGADRLVRLTGDLQGRLNVHAYARAIARFLQSEGQSPDLILTGVQANNSLDGSLGPQLAALLGLPFVDYAAHVVIEDRKIVVRKEFPEGLVADWAVNLPVVLGIQAANTPPRYVPFSKIRQAMKSCDIGSAEVEELDSQGAVASEKAYLPDSSQRALMLEGDVEEVAEKMVALFKEIGAL